MPSISSRHTPLGGGLEAEAHVIPADAVAALARIAGGIAIGAGLGVLGLSGDAFGVHLELHFERPARTTVGAASASRLRTVWISACTYTPTSFSVTSVSLL